MRILIVEDEKENALGLSSFIHRLNDGDECVLAENGKEALRVLEREGPFDLVFADVCMPVMDGVEFLKQARFQYPALRVVMLSAHDSFQYARESLRFGAMDYLLKPMQPKEVSQLITYVRSVIDASNVRNAIPSEYTQGLLGRWLINPMEFAGSVLNLLPKCSYARMMICCANEVLRSVNAHRSSESIQMEMRAAVAFCLENVTGCVSCLPVPDLQNDARFILLLFSNQEHFDLFTSDVPELAAELKKAGGATYSFVLSDVLTNPVTALPYAFRQTDGLCEYLFYAPQGALLRPVECRPSREQNEQLRAERKELLAHLSDTILSGDTDGVREAVEQFEKSIAPPYLSLFEFFDDLVVFIGTVSRELRAKIPAGAIFDRMEENARMLLEERGSIELLLEKLSNFAQGAAEALESCQADRNAVVFQDVLMYIQANLSDPLFSQKDVSDHFYFSTSYFSTMFRKYINMPFVLYLNTERINKAKNLLTNPDKAIADVALSCGFQGSGYFSRVFKKHTGMTPQEYRRFVASGVLHEGAEHAKE